MATIAIELNDAGLAVAGPGGMLFIGHSESLSGVRHQFRYVQPTVYAKE